MTCDKKPEPEPNILKVRDDQIPIQFERLADGGFQLCEGSNASWAQSKTFDLKQLRARIEPWLTALFQSEHLRVLLGSGLTHAIHRQAAGYGAAGMAQLGLKTCAVEIKNSLEPSAIAAGRATANLEDEIRVANELLRGLQILQDERASQLKAELEKALKEFAESVLESEAGIANADSTRREKAFDCLVSFLMSFASRTGTRDRLNIFTTNYDRLIEAGAEIAGLHLLDRFVGNLAPIFRSSRLDLDMHYNPPGIRGEPRYLEGVARFTKLHGSLDWMHAGEEIRRIALPFGVPKIAPFLQVPGFAGGANELMIYPNAAKDRETAGYPYVELFRDLAAAVCRPNSTLVTYGYSFGDEHINRVIRDMLTIPSTHLVAISFSDPQQRIINSYKKIGRPSQISLLVGDVLGDLSTLTNSFLPKAAIDRTTIRMSDLIRQRFGSETNGKTEGAGQKIEGIGE